MLDRFSEQERAVLRRIQWCEDWLKDSEDVLYHYDMANVNLDSVMLALIEARKACNKVCALLAEIVEDNDLHHRK